MELMFMNKDSRRLCFDREHGGNIYKIAEELGAAEEELIDFSASINPLGISDRVKAVIANEVDALIHYPDPDANKLRRAIAGHYGIDPETVLCGNGSTELIYLVPRALKPKEVLVTAPAFSEYERACALNDELRITNYELREEDRFEIKSRKFIDAMQGCDMAFLCNPNNPTGQLLSRTEVLKIAGAARDAKCCLVVDEAFIDFCPGASVIPAVQGNPYLIVLRSMTKFHALTGLRAGFAVIHTDVMGIMKEYKEPWTVNSLAQKAAIAALEDTAYAEATFSLLEAEKKYLEKSFRDMGMEFVPSAVNYYLLNVRDAGSITQRLREKGLLVRDCSNFKGMDSSYVRVAVKSHEHNRMLVEELSKV